MRGPVRREIPRKRLLQRVRMVEPRLLWLVAPAGWGKTTFANAVRAKSADAAVIDCRGINDATTFATQILAALRGDLAQPGGGGHQQHLPFDEHGFDLPAAAVRAWHTADGPSLVVFDSAERLNASVALRDVLARLLAQPHPSRRVVIASRWRIDVPTSAFAPPNEVLSLDARDLCFDTTEIRRLFGAGLADDNEVARVVAATAGWPIAVLILVAAARQGNIAGALAEMERGASGVLADYFAHEVLDCLDPRGRDAFVAAATFPSGLPVWGVTVPNERTFPLADTPFVLREQSGKPDIHPLVRALVAQRYQARAKALAADIASTVGDGGDHVTAAHASMWLGDQDAAARALADCAPFLTGALEPRAGAVLAALSRETLVRYPAVWSAATLPRAGAVDIDAWLGECRQVHAELPAATRIVVRSGVTSAYAYAAGVTGNFQEGRAALAALLAVAANAVCRRTREDPRLCDILVCRLRCVGRRPGRYRALTARYRTAAVR